ncbi:MAG: insulinase family protein [Oscillospiraceae bacterium]|nr:insulinase family protein [Oscillospiraceae bacterium]
MDITSPGLGVRVLRLPQPSFPTARVTLTWLCPLRAGQAARSAIVPFLLARGDDFTALQRRLNRLYGARVSADVGRIGGMQALSLTLSSVHRRFALHGEDIEAEMTALLQSLTAEPVFTEEALAVEKRCLYERRLAEFNEKRVYARQRAEELLYGAVHPLGEAEEIGALTLADVCAAWERMQSTAQIQLLLQNVDALTLPFPAAALSARADTGTADTPPVFKKNTVSERMPVHQSKLVLGFGSPVRVGQPLTWPMRLMAMLWGGSPQSLLFMNVREKMSLCYYCLAAYDRHTGALLAECGVDEAQVDAAKAAVLHELACIQQGDFSDEDLENARRALCNAFAGVADAQADLAAFYVGQSLQKEILTPGQAAAAIEAVTRSEVIEAAGTVTHYVTYALLPDGTADADE